MKYLTWNINYRNSMKQNEYEELIMKDLLSSYSQIFIYKATDSIYALYKIYITCLLGYILNKFE